MIGHSCPTAARSRNVIDAVIFDLDGLLADTEKLHREAYREVLTGIGFVLDDGEYDEHWIRDGKGIAEFVAKHDLAIKADDLRRLKGNRYRSLVRSRVKPMPGARAALDGMSGCRTLGLATASYAHDASVVIDTLGFQDYFVCTVTRSDVERVKPFPDLFLAAAARLGVDPGACLVVEDAQKGVRAAVAAGMACVAVPNEHTRDNDFSGAVAVLDSLHELTPARLESIERSGGE
jgi:HAD superfamily hydrolase (TIGR01509 family)